MLLVVTIRREGEKTAHGHIVDSNCVQAFCSVGVPSAVMEIGLENVGNPYVGKVPVSCTDCKSEYHNGRRAGFRENG